MVKKINIAFIWHFHQPLYQENFDGDFLMPWTRLHATKDYLDMLLKINKFKNIKLNFNFSPTLIDSLERYKNGSHDIHSRLLVSKISELSENDKMFILNNFFDADYNHLILDREYYSTLYNKRYLKSDIKTTDFKDQEYSDLMANFTLCWFNKNFYDKYPELKELSKKQKHYTQKDRIKIYEYTLKIIKDIIPTYKSFQDKGKIEISTSPYYHPILPLLLNLEELPLKYKENLPKNRELLKDDAIEQTKKSLDRFEKLFGKRPKGIWLSEQCISKKTIKMLSDLGVNWTISDIQVLSKTLNKEFLRSFDGTLKDPYDISVNYKLKGTDTNILFSDSFILNLIGFNYGAHRSEVAANDLYERIKTIQNRLQNSPNNDHLITIAMDGENCWESYENNGNNFLNALYRLIENDETLETVLVSDYMEKNKHTVKLDNIKSGSWINGDFGLWVGEAVKNVAWSYVCEIREIANKFIKTSKDKELNKKILEEIYILEGSDWFWWYGEPNDSGRDHIFDYLFRAHLINICKLMGKKPDEKYNVPLISIVGKPIRHPRNNITPAITGIDSKENDLKWQDAGCIVLPDGPTGSNSVVKSMYFGHDKNNIYLRFDLNKTNIKVFENIFLSELYICFKNSKNKNQALIRLTNKTDNITPVVSNYFTNELKLSFNQNLIFPSRFSKVTKDGLWVLQSPKNIVCNYHDIIELAISFDDLEVKEKSSIELCAISAHNGIIDKVFPQDIMIKLRRE